MALGSLVIIVLTGAAVRLTGSGLGCSDWPTCENNSLAPTSATDFHPMIEFLNRLFTGVVSLSVVAALIGAYRRSPKRRDLILGAWGLVFGVAANGILGGFTVLFELKPIFVIGHFLLSMLLLWDAVVLVRRAGSVPGPRQWASPGPIPGLCKATVVVASLVLISGTIVTGTGPNGGDEEVERLALSLREVARVHSLIAWALVALSVAVAVQTAAASRTNQRAMKAAYRLVVAVVAQGAIGYVQYFAGVPPVLVGIHVLGSVLVWMAAIDLYLSHRHPVAGTDTYADPVAPDSVKEWTGADPQIA